ncbi:MAG: protein kinase [Elainellaceae cyanobacterium]
MTLTTGATLQGGRYTIQGACHHTQVEVTYGATHQLLDQPVLIKTLRLEAFAAAEQAAVQASFAIAASRFAQCVHPHLARVIDCFYEADTPYLVWETIAGESLRSRVESQGPARPQEALQELRQLAGAVQQLHDHGLVHGAIAPGAVYYRPKSGEVVLTEVNLAGALLPATTVNRAGMRADLRGLAVVFYSRLIGDTVDGALLGTAQSLPVLQARQPDLAAAVEQAILLGLEAGTDAAPLNVSTWLVQVEAALQSAPLTVTPPAIAPTVPSISMGQNSPPGTGLAAMSSPEQLRLDVFPPEMTQTDTDPPLANPACPVNAHSPAAPIPAEPLGQAAVAKKSAERSPLWLGLLPPSRPWIPLTLGMTAIAAAFGGGYLGLALRLQDAEQLESAPILGSEIFGRDQAFPPTDNWPTPSRRQRAAAEDILFEPVAPEPHAPALPPSRQDSTVNAIEQAPPPRPAVTDPELLTNLESDGESFSVWESMPLTSEENPELSNSPEAADPPGEAETPSRKKPITLPDAIPPAVDPPTGDRLPPLEAPPPLSPPPAEGLPSSDSSTLLPPTVAPSTPLPEFESAPQDVSHRAPVSQAPL